MDRNLERLVWSRAGACCEYCRIPQQHDVPTFEIDHIIPRKHLGATVASNLALSCFHCNRYKGSNLSGRDPVARHIHATFQSETTSGRGISVGRGRISRGEPPLAVRQSPRSGSTITCVFCSAMSSSKRIWFQPEKVRGVRRVVGLAAEHPSMESRISCVTSPSSRLHANLDQNQL